MKKLLAILGMITCMVGLCACGQEEAADPNEASMLQFGEATLENIDEIVNENAVEQYASDEVIYAGLLGWKDALKDIGTFEVTAGGSAHTTDEEMVISVEVLGSSHNATVEFVVDAATGAFTGITTNVKYSTGEIMLKAGMNTLIGMGTVFVVLILISLIISCFSLISKMESKKKTEASAPAANAQPAPAAVQPAVQEELSDDTELVAVIAAAIAAYEGSGSTDGFVVRSIRKSNKSKWQNA